MIISLPARFVEKHRDSSPVAALIAQISSRLRTYRARRAVYRQTCHELISLSDRELADISIPRCHIRRVAREAAQRVKAHA